MSTDTTVPALVHMFQPGRYGTERLSVHYAAPNGQEVMCGHAKLFRTIDGDKIPTWFETKRPITCLNCTKRAEILVRFQLPELTAEQLEDVLAVIAGMRNGHAKEEVTPDGVG
jgi:hypothetical protein